MNVGEHKLRKLVLANVLLAAKAKGLGICSQHLSSFFHMSTLMHICRLEAPFCGRASNGYPQPCKAIAIDNVGHNSLSAMLMLMLSTFASAAHAGRMLTFTWIAIFVVSLLDKHAVISYANLCTSKVCLPTPLPKFLGCALHNVCFARSISTDSVCHLFLS